jgi:hypothetical protein
MYLQWTSLAPRTKPLTHTPHSRTPDPRLGCFSVVSPLGVGKAHHTGAHREGLFLGLT